MVKEPTLKLFLTNGITLTFKDSEFILVDDATVGLVSLGAEIEKCIETKSPLIVDAKLVHEYQDGEEIKQQDVSHHYYIPSERISWYIIEEV